MKVFFYIVRSLDIPFLEIALDLISDHLEKGNEVYVLGCCNSLDFCFHKQKGAKIKCILCQGRFKLGLSSLKLSSENIFFLNKKYIKDFKFTIPNFRSIEELKKFEVNEVNFGRAVTASMVSLLRDHRFDTVAYSKSIDKMLRSSILIYKNIDYLLGLLKPDLCYVSNGRGFESRPAIKAYKRHGISFCTYEKANCIYKYLVIKDSIVHNLDSVKKLINHLWNFKSQSLIEKIAIGKEWYENRRRKIKEWHFFATNSTKGLLPKEFENNKRNIVIFNSSRDEYESFSGWKFAIYKDEIDAISRMVESFKDEADICFYLRIHPNLGYLNNTQIKLLKKLNEQNFKNLKIIWPEEKIDSYSLIDNCEKVVAFGSTIGVEASFWGKPSILIGRAYYEDLDCCYVPQSHQEVIEFINNKIKPKPQLGSIIHGYWQIEYGYPFKKFKPTYYFNQEDYFKRQVVPTLGFTHKNLVKINFAFKSLKSFSLRLRPFLGRIKQKMLER